MNDPAQNTQGNSSDSNNVHKNSSIKVSQAASLLNVSSSSLRRLESEGRIASERLGNNYRTYRLDRVLDLKKQLEEEKIQKQNQKVERKIQNILSPTPQPIIVTNTKTQNISAQPASSIQKTEIKEQVLTNYSEKTTIKAINIPQAEKYIRNKLTNKVLPYTFAISMLIAGSLAFANLAPKEFKFKVADTLGAIIFNNSVSNEKSFSNLAAILAARSRVSNFIYNVNIPTNFKNDINVTGLATLNGGLLTNNAPGNFGTGTVTVGTLAFTGIGNMTNLQNFDEVSENTYERLIDINGDVVGTGLTT
jgi:excisionase family DNA binding protein